MVRMLNAYNRPLPDFQITAPRASYLAPFIYFRSIHLIFDTAWTVRALVVSSNTGRPRAITNVMDFALSAFAWQLQFALFSTSHGISRPDEPLDPTIQKNTSP